MPKISIKSKKILLAIVSFLVLACCIITAHFFSAFLLRTESVSTSVSTPSFDLYLLSLSKSQVKTEALSSCPDYQQIGAGGYVYQKDNYYYVVSSAYLNKNDAVLVQNSLTSSDIKSEIVLVKFKSFSIAGNFDSSQSKVLSKAISSPIEFYKEIYDIAISLDTSVYNEISARMAVNNAHNNLSASIDNFAVMFENYTDEIFKSITLFLQKIKDISQNLCGGTLLNNNQTYSSLLKYRYLEILSLYYDFVNN